MCGKRAPTFYSLVRTARLYGAEPETCLTDVIARVGSHPINRLAELLRWNWQLPAAPPEPVSVKWNEQE